MKTTIIEIDHSLMDTLATYMDDDIREDLHSSMAKLHPTHKDNLDFLRAYCERDPEHMSLLESEFPEVADLVVDQ